MFAAFDTNYWGIWIVPVGLVLCFGPALVVWIREELRSKPTDKDSKER